MLAYQQGEKEAFSVIYERLHEPLYCFLFRYTREEQLSIDIVQDTFEVLQKKQQLYEIGSGTVKAYLFQIGYRLLMNKLNRRRKWRTLLPFLVPIAAPIVQSDDKIVIQQAIAELPEKQRAVILLAYYEDLRQQDIAQILNIPVGTVKSRLHQAMQTLKQQLREGFYDEG